MPRQFILILGMLGLFLSTTALASTDTTLATPTSIQAVTSPAANINKGNMEVGGYIGFAYSTLGGFVGQLDPSFKYFFFNHLSLGGTAYWNVNQIESTLSAGPSATYYIGLFDRWAPFIGQDFQTQLSGGVLAQTWTSTTHIGADYFITRDIAFGPSLNFTKTLGNGADTSLNISLLGAFGLFF